MKATLLNTKKIILEKYQYNIFDYEDELMDEEEEWDDRNNLNWVQIWKFGNRYFKVWGMNGTMDGNCVELTQKKEMREITYYEEI